MIDGEQSSEFWNRDDDASGSDEDISDSDGILFLFFIFIYFFFFMLGVGGVSYFQFIISLIQPLNHQMLLRLSRAKPSRSYQQSQG